MIATAPQTNQFSFVIDRKGSGKLKRVSAVNFDQALNKILALNPGKFVTTTFARNLAGIKRKQEEANLSNRAMRGFRLQVKPFKLIINTMDLITAKVEAAAQSAKLRKKMYINLDAEGECIISSIPSKDEQSIMAIYLNGNEVPITPEAVEVVKETKTAPVKSSSTKTKEKMEAQVKTKVAAKKSAAKKPVKKESAPAKKVAADKPDNLEGRATTLQLTPAQWKKVDGSGVKLREMVRLAIVKMYC